MEDLAYLDADAKVIALRGAKLAELKVADWFEADRLSNDELRESIDNNGLKAMSVKRLPPVNGPFTMERINSRIFIVVETTEKRLAVIDLKNREFGQLYMRCRARDADIKALDGQGHTAAELAKRNGHEGTAKFLLEKESQSKLTDYSNPIKM